MPSEEDIELDHYIRHQHGEDVRDDTDQISIAVSQNIEKKA